MNRKEDKQKSQDQEVTFTEESLRELFDGCADVEFYKATTSVGPILVVYCQGLFDQSALFDYALRPILQNKRRRADLKNVLPANVKELGNSITKEKMVDIVFRGEVIILQEEDSRLFRVNAIGHPMRNVEEPSTEVSIRGSKEGFVEELIMNTALVRKRLRTSSLKVVNFVIGTRTKTNVQLMYLEDVTNTKIVEEAKKRLGNIDIDGVESSLQIEELLSDRKHSFFPLFVYTGRPDYVVESLMHGRFAILVDGTPTALIAPVNLFFILKTAEDSNVSSNFVLFERILRVIGLFIALFVPAFWIALITFHPDQLPFTLLATVTLSRDGVPFPAPVECFLMLFLFELFREAGVRLPMVVGQILSVVGGLIIGQAAIAAGLTAPGILVVNAVALVATFTLVNQSLTGLVAILRLVILLITSFFGMFGFFISLFAVTGYLASLRSFGVPYLTPFAPFKPKDLQDAMWNSADDKYQRPEMLDPIDTTRREQ
ncbi:spore germination protein [Salimicrobium halophilum]|uniref:GerA spore germination protein n=1 Tax=Salimicrobium halophilum TaxID=86666 RepID=A0A1G8QXT8_9BACI|nr:spore germination protein [Salimicrobium halophilum]SDJ09491.1 GerA spore germination protein [Salimicrobium halophilum]